jgi:hypothetical protein
VHDTRVAFRGQVTRLSASAEAILQELGWTSTSVAGTENWLFDGETLDDRRHRHEELGDEAS